MASDGRSYVTGYFQLELDGDDAGIVQRAAGIKRSGGRIELDDGPELAFQVELSLAQPVKDWIDASLRGGDERRSGALRVGGAGRRDQHQAIGGEPPRR